MVDANALRQLPDLRVVAACRGDAVNVDVEACTAFGIPVLFAPGRNAVAVADLAVGFMINLARKLPAATQFLRREDCTAGNMSKMGQAFSQLQGRELWRKTIGLVGLGAVGRAVAKRLAGFEAEILVADPFVTPEQAALAGCRLTDLDTLLRRSDFVSLHAAVTPATTGMIGADEFAKMKPGAFFINTARAALIDEQALVDALESGHLGGAGLDTFAVEPPGFDHPLVQHPGVISTPHSAGNTVEVADHQGESVSAALVQLLRGETPRCVLNPQTLATSAGRAPSPSRASGAGQAAATRAGRRSPTCSATPRRRRRRQPESAATVACADGCCSRRADVVEKMKAILEKFCAGMAADPALNAFSADQDVTLHFTAHDLGLDFHLGLKQGRVLSALGAATAARGSATADARRDTRRHVHRHRRRHGVRHERRTLLHGRRGQGHDAATAPGRHGARSTRPPGPRWATPATSPRCRGRALRRRRRNRRCRRYPRGTGADRARAVRGAGHHRHRRQRQRAHPGKRQ